MTTIKNKFKALLKNKSLEQLLQEDADILSSNYLSEIERILSEKELSKKDLAKDVGVSPSYLSQVFRGDKPLNFLTLAKLKRALKLRIDVVVNLDTENVFRIYHARTPDEKAATSKHGANTIVESPVITLFANKKEITAKGSTHQIAS